MPSQGYPSLRSSQCLLHGEVSKLAPPHIENDCNGLAMIVGTMLALQRLLGMFCLKMSKLDEFLARKILREQQPSNPCRNK